MSMKEPLPPQRLYKALEDARQARGAACAELARRTDSLPRPGDVYAFPALAEHGVLGAVVEFDASEGRRCQVVPLDPQNLVGSADLALAEAGAGTSPSFGAAVLRCGLSEWLSSAAFEGVERVGALCEEDVTRARGLQRRLAAGERTTSPLRREVDALREYKERLEEVERACAALRGKVGEAATPALGVEVGTVVEKLPSSPHLWRNFERVYALAASALLVAGLFTLQQKRQELVTVRAAAAEEQAAARDRLHEAQTTVARSELERERLERENESLRAGVAPDPKPVVGFSVTWLNPRETVRSGADFTVVHAARGLVVLDLYFQESLSVETTLRLQVVTYPDEQEVLRLEDSQPAGTRSLGVQLPSDTLPAGKYWLDLFAIEAGETRRLGEYAVEIKEPGS